MDTRGSQVQGMSRGGYAAGCLRQACMYTQTTGMHSHELTATQWFAAPQYLPWGAINVVQEPAGRATVSLPGCPPYLNERHSAERDVPYRRPAA